MEKIRLTEEELNEFLQAMQEHREIERLGDFNGRFDVSPFKFDAYAIIHLRQNKNTGLFNLITKEGKLLFDEWFILAMTFKKEGITRAVRTNGEVLKIDKNGKIVSVWKEK